MKNALTQKDQKGIVAELKPKAKKDKNKKMLKRINKIIDRLEKLVTKLHQASQKLQALKDVYTERKAA